VEEKEGGRERGRGKLHLVAAHPPRENKNLHKIAAIKMCVFAGWWTLSSKRDHGGCDIHLRTE
jgi:hypothetical protein